MSAKKIGMVSIDIDQETEDKVLRALRSGKFIKGPETVNFEKEFATHHGSSHGVACSNGTTALHLTYADIGIRPGDEVILPSHTYLASATPAIHLGATPVWSEVDHTMTMDIDDLQAKITPKTKCITAVHLYGRPARMKAIQEVADEHGIPVVADSAQAHDAAIDGSPIGAFGDYQTFSFYPSKNMTVAGDGGMVLTNDTEAAKRISMLRDHGRTPDKKYENDLLGYNFRLSDVLAAVGRCQLKHLSDWTDRRREIAAKYVRELGELDGLKLPDQDSSVRHVYHQFVVRCRDRDGLAEHLKSDGIDSGLHYPVPTHLQPCVAERFVPPSLPHTEQLVKQILSIPVHHGMSEGDVNRVVASVSDFFGSP